MPGKLLYTASTYSHIANFHLPYLRAFREAGWTVHVACGGTAMALPEADRVVDVPFAKRMTAPENLGCARRLGELMKCEAYDLVITHTSLAAFFTRLPLLGRKDRPRVINTVHGYLFDDDTT
ncbi:glycosyltransferase, partial [Intestinimonas butyriciproducens]